MTGNSEDPLLRVRNLVVEFPNRASTVKAVSGISFDLRRGETLALVGESGCGKSTTARAVIQLPRPTSGQVLLDGEDLTQVSNKRMRELRPRLQIIFQDPIASLNPRAQVAEIVGAPLRINELSTSVERQARVEEMLEAVGLDPRVSMKKRPHEFSGGQCQRISIARALILSPDILLCDEPVSALDVSIQAQILNLLEDMKERHALTMLFISHDLAVVKSVADRVGVMYLGKLCEISPAQELYHQPVHPYTQALLSAIPIPDPEIKPIHLPMIESELPSPMNPPSGCVFRTRCPLAEERCAHDVPELRTWEDGREVACHLAS